MKIGENQGKSGKFFLVPTLLHVNAVRTLCVPNMKYTERKAYSFHAERMCENLKKPPNPLWKRWEKLKMCKSPLFQRGLGGFFGFSHVLSALEREKKSLLFKMDSTWQVESIYEFDERLKKGSPVEYCILIEAIQLK